jgi:hypothetical protein
MKTKMPLNQRLHALFSGKKLFWVDDLKKLTFASSEKQCKSRFKGHETEVYPFEGLTRVFWFILTGRYSDDYSPTLVTRWRAVILRMKAEDTQGNIRKGQRLFNSLFEVDPTMANSIRGTNIDPFHDDSKIDDFIGFVIAQWMHQNRL